VALPESKHVHKRFNQSDLFRVFAVPCPVDNVYVYAIAHPGSKRLKSPPTLNSEQRSVYEMF